jgi:hypothetical protein
MQILLHILTRPDDALARRIIVGQQQIQKNKTLVADLTKAEPDYKELVENIFAADCVQVW